MLCSGLCNKIFPWFTPRRVILLFASSNFLFMGFDVALAHFYNRFVDTREWIPILYSAVGGCVVLIYAFVQNPSKLVRTLFSLICWIGVGVGLVGFYLHIDHTIWHEISLKLLVYAAPVAAPLSYAGVALVALAADGSFDRFKITKRRALLFLAAAGLLGNLALTVLDHARNGFFEAEEWASVAVSAFGTVVLFGAALKKKPTTREENITVLIALVLQIITGLIGFGYHVHADWHNIMPTIPEKIVFGAPIFAPLLFCDVAGLGLIALFMKPEGEDWVKV